jgi:hypothetical protein
VRAAPCSGPILPDDGVGVVWKLANIACMFACLLPMQPFSSNIPHRLLLQDSMLGND